MSVSSAYTVKHIQKGLTLCALKKCRVEITRAGLGDYCCPPSGVAILFNNIPGPKKINWVQGSTHGYVPPEPHQAFSIEGNGWSGK